jgi:tRNA wybutosine-synthesizing protein 3
MPAYIFEKRKRDILGKADKSDKGNWDKPMQKLMDKINKNNNYYTTSSCSGRIVLIKYSDKKQENLFLFRTHYKTNFAEIKKELRRIRYSGLIYFKEESCILHVACRTLADAQRILDKGKLAGWKKSGIISSNKRFICELMGAEYISLPIMNNRKTLVSEDYLKLIIKEANRKLSRAWEKIKKLEKSI